MAYVARRQYSISEYILHQSLNPEHELLQLAARIDWEEIAYRLRPYYKVRGRRAKPVRLMVGLRILWHRYDLADEVVVAQLHENIYRQAFCGVDWPILTDGKGKIVPTALVEPSTLTKFRERVGAAGTAKVEAIIRDQMIKEKGISPKAAIVDTTAQPKHIAYPLDTHLLHRGRTKLIGLMKKAQGLGIRLPDGLRSFQRKSRQVLIGLQKLGGDRMERIEQGSRILAGYAKQVIKRAPAVLRALTQRIRKEREQKGKQRLQRVGLALKQMTERVRLVIARTKARFAGIHLPKKLYSLHEPQVVCIRKGKRERPNEYGSKVVLSVDRSGYVVTHQEIAGNPADAHLLEGALTSWQRATGSLPEEVVGDRGMTPKRGGEPALLGKIARVALPSRGKRRRPEESKPYFKRLLRKRVIIEPIISRLKSDHRMDRCRYKGFVGDQINVAWAVMAWNTKKWIRESNKRASGKQKAIEAGCRT